VFYYNRIDQGLLQAQSHAMCIPIIFTCGEQTFQKDVPGYEGLVCKCWNCGNLSASVIKSHPWFTFCFIVRLDLDMGSLRLCLSKAGSTG
jgi:hypothetical protein